MNSIMNARDGDDTLDDMRRMNVHDYGKVQERRGWSQRTKRRLMYMSVIGLLLFIITLSVTLSKEGNSLSTDGPRIPKPEVDSPALNTNTDELGSFLIEVYAKLGVTNTPWTVEGSPQYLALQWVSGRDEYTNYQGTQRIQRYALACFYYATFMKPHLFLDTASDWSSQENWITDESECTWEGVNCNKVGNVFSIDLPEHNLSGSIPIELALLPHLEEFDITSNNVYMEGNMHLVWKHLVHMKKILLEDNFIVTTTGLPTEFASLTNLESIHLSYNLLQGNLTNEVFANMQKLQHIEIESNYIAGDIPSVLGSLPNLQYLYLRRNEMTISLHNMMVSGGYPSIFSLWIDNNIVTSTIPTQIGLFVGLASFSMTNATVSGKIPTEIGLLADMQRMWLYDNKLNGQVPTEIGQLEYLEVFEIHNNQLSGTVPASVCDSVAASTYDLRSLTADCDRVTCDKCCTKCYPIK